MVNETTYYLFLFTGLFLAMLFVGAVLLLTGKEKKSQQ